MSRPRSARLDLRALLDAVEAASPVDAVEVLAKELARAVGADDVSFLIADFSGDALIRLVSVPTTVSAPEVDCLVTVPLAGSKHQEAVRSQKVCIEERPDSYRLYAPVTDRGDALGVLELSLAGRPDADTVRFVAAAAHALAYVVIANRRHTDLYERGQRNAPFSLGAEIQRRLLPASFTCEAAEFTVAGWLEPASEAAGDTFDYSVERDTLHLSISDAKGHAVDAAQLATLAVGSLRNSRRGRSSVLAQATAANEAIFAHGGDEDYVTALLVRLDLTDGSLKGVNAGHPAPYLVRDGVVTVLDWPADLPLGMFSDVVYRELTFNLRVGDRLVMLTDGVLERNATAIDVAVTLQAIAELHPREVVHTFARELLRATGGSLQDDATLLCIDWYGRREGQDRVSRAGASQSRASRPIDG